MPVRRCQTIHRAIWKAWLAVACMAGSLLAADDNTSDKPAPMDPVEANGAIFADWPRPDVVLLFSGEQDGYMEPCGCAGLDNQKGGLKRRHSLIKQLESDTNTEHPVWPGTGPPVVAMDLGGLVKRFGPQARIKYRYSLASLTKMGYAAVGIGTQDLHADLLSTVINLDSASNPLLCANVGILGFDSGFSKRYEVIEAGDMKIGVTAVVGTKQLAGFKGSDDLTLLDPADALSQILPELQSAGCDQFVLLSFADPDETKDLARQFTQFDWIVTAHGAEEPPSQPTPIAGTKGRLIEVGQKGMYVVAVGLYRNGPTPYRYQRVPLDSRFTDSPEMQELFVAYQRDLETLGLEGLGVKPAAHPTGRRFVGSETCADCHTAATEVYENTPHAHATETLLHLVPPRHFDPECLSCHVTGWEPQKYYPFVSGYLSVEKTPAMVGNGCENCHGPAARHVAAENGEIDADDDELERLRATLRLKIVENEGNQDGQVYGKVVDMCMQCHDLDNSPEFDFQRYWPDVAHEGKD